MSSLPIAFSPCPNDTYLFHAWADGRLQDAPVVQPQLADIQSLNRWALEGRYPVSKVSVNCVGKILDNYVLLPVGCALGDQCGPKIVSNHPYEPRELAGKRIALPGQDTTAYLLFQLLWEQPMSVTFSPYETISAEIKEGRVDCGVLIHETRFSFEKNGLYEVADLGQLWEKRYHLPLPLGGVVAKRELGQELLKQITSTIERSLIYAKEHPQAALSYILAHSQEKDLQIIQQHISLYVNADTMRLSPNGIASIDTLFRLARERGLLPQCSMGWLFEEYQSLIYR